MGLPTVVSEAEWQAARDTAFALISRAPYEEIRAFKERMGWTLPWFSSFGTDFNYDFGVTTDRGEIFALRVEVPR